MTKHSDRGADVASLVADLHVMADVLEKGGVAPPILEVLRTEVADAARRGDWRDLRATRTEIAKWCATLPEPLQHELAQRLQGGEMDETKTVVEAILAKGSIESMDEFYAAVEALSDLTRLPENGRERGRLGEIVRTYENSIADRSGSS